MYSLNKINVLIEGIGLLKKEEIKNMALAFRIAQADKKDFEKFLKE